jgi:hypothetical protein
LVSFRWIIFASHGKGSEIKIICRKQYFCFHFSSFVYKIFPETWSEVCLG